MLGDYDLRLIEVRSPEKLAGFFTSYAKKIGSHAGNRFKCVNFSLIFNIN
jgi:hypothetical protein